MNSNKKRYRYFHPGSTNSSNGQFSIYSYKNLLRSYSEEAIQVLMHCNEFRTLENHARNHLQIQKLRILSQPSRLPFKKISKFFASTLAAFGEDLPVSDREVGEVRRRLELFVSEGLLISQQELNSKAREAVAYVEEPEEHPEKINILGIPTRNRANVLSRCLKSYLDNLQRNHRSCSVHIVDDSDDDQRTNQNKQSITELFKQYDTDFFWVDHNVRHKLARTVAQAGNLPEEILRFALLGDSRCPLRTGASRNTLLLLSAGELSVQVDDDTICQMAPTPGIEEGITLSSETRCNQYWYYNQLEAIIDLENNYNRDFLSLHETLLGKHPSRLIRENSTLNTDFLGGTLLEQLRHPNLHIATTLLGSLGDSGMFRHWQRLSLNGDSFRRLVQDDSKYRENLCTRQILRGVRQQTVGEGPFCMAMNIGLNTRQLLPPFMPVQRNQDGIFGWLLHLCFPQTCRGYIPYAIVHDPPDRSSQAELSHSLSVGPLRTPDILEALLLFLYQWPFSEDSAHNVKIAGSYLFDLNQYSHKRFKMEVWERCHQVMVSRIRYLKQCLDERWDAPEYWKNDVRKVISNSEELLRQQEMGIPCDLPGNASERLAIFQDLVGKFGQLLIHWPAIWETAKELREQEKLTVFGNRNSKL